MPKSRFVLRFINILLFDVFSYGIHDYQTCTVLHLVFGGVGHIRSASTTNVKKKEMGATGNM
ncbi:hypothetical protein PR003_g30316 [Phytophthora rubi]|uniref:Uncharacterized protein n=1 Tax=Phytophthora rubi TaxID=129364 RepID=A0A6A4BFF0_9STRA|nr:hypothetical protein PR001_g29163 [Phytophthora rubi]KAE9272086.1 hypothetical protein PR003_g30316 [Phytophthora rubi]